MNIDLPIYSTLHCVEEIHCSQCRTDAAWRRSVAEFFGGPVDFDCPLGKPITGERSGEVLPAPPPRPPRPQRQPRQLAPSLTPEEREHRRVEAERVAKEREAARLAQYRFPPPPGDRLAELFASFGVTHGGGCACAQNAEIMNREFLAVEQEMPDATYAEVMEVYQARHLDEIVRFLQDGARAKTGIAPAAWLIRPAVKMVFNKWVKDHG